MPEYLKIGLIVLGSILIVLSIVLLVVLKRKNNKKDNFDYEKFVDLLGGLNNIEEASYAESRLILKVKDKKDVKRDELIEMANCALVVTSKKITLTMGGLSSKVCAYILKNKG